jgi:hypothetical protein
MIEQHSIASLSARLGLSRGATLGAISAGRLPVVEKITFGARVAYRIEGESIEAYRAQILKKLESKIARVSADPNKRRELMAGALRAIRLDLEAEAKITTAPKLAERYGISLEAAAYVLGRYARRVDGGFVVDAAARAAIEKHIRETRGGAAIRNAGGPFVS